MNPIAKISRIVLVWAWILLPLSFIMANQWSGKSAEAIKFSIAVYLTFAILATVSTLVLSRKANKIAVYSLGIFNAFFACTVLSVFLFIFPAFFTKYDVENFNFILVSYTAAWAVFAIAHGFLTLPKTSEIQDFFIKDFKALGTISGGRMIEHFSIQEKLLLNKFNDSLLKLAFPIIMVLLLILGLNLRKAYPEFSTMAISTAMSFLLACLIQVYMMSCICITAAIQTSKKLGIQLPSSNPLHPNK
ncbi:hypothetical protein ACFFU8_01245 [Chromobacterium piscinae]|uniref:hypothetical protein n=1 Tax=Chromobacterium piscinae TaxID=686831 RepID=UPI001E6231C8|nr:hypothetical protein [Chromobacterium piscinae]MCD5330667.1 hypothetical protein [Chromobacterium piscinae]